MTELNGNGEAVLHRRSDDAFIARWARRLAFYLVPICLTLVGYFWNDRKDHIQRLNTSISNMGTINSRIDVLDVRLTVAMANSSDNQEEMRIAQQEIKTELGALRVEVREMYKRAIAAGGKNP